MNSLAFGALLDYVYFMFTENMDEEAKEEFDRDIFPEKAQEANSADKLNRRLFAIKYGNSDYVEVSD